MEGKKQRLSIIFFSGDYDKAIATLILATTAASSGMEVGVFCTFWGLSLLKKGKRFRGKNLMLKMLEFMNPGNKETLPLSKMNMVGIGRSMMKKIMKSKKTPSVSELYDMAIELGVKFYACSTSCQVMGIEREDLRDDVKDIVGAATFLKEATDSDVTLFI